MKQIFTDNLPTKTGFGKNKNKIMIDWKNSVDCIIPFIYEEYNGVLWIKSYNSKKQEVKFIYKNNIFTLKTNQLLNVGLGNVIGKFNYSYKYKIGDIIKTELGEGEILRLLRNKNSGRRYEIRCRRCNKTYERDEGKVLDINRSVKCPHYSNGSKSFCERFIYSLLSKLDAVCLGKRKSHKGYKFKYKEEE